MKIKLDENLSPRLIAIFEKNNHDARTVLDEGLSGHSDESIYRVCQTEKRVLITLDHDFGNILRFPLQESEGIIILDTGRLPSMKQVEELALKTSHELLFRPIKERLWIVQKDRIRVRPFLQIC
ncbi:MAG: DUF5615 family PIN-like protein [bacterium]